MEEEKTMQIYATWHEDDSIWLATCPEMRGFVVEANSMEELQRLLAITVPDYWAEIHPSDSSISTKNCDFDITQRQALAC